MHGDDEPYGSIQHVSLFSRFPPKTSPPDKVSIMNRAATEDDRALVWPVVSRVLRRGPAPNALDQQVVDMLDEWVTRDAPKLDADNDGLYDDPEPEIMDTAWRRWRARSWVRCTETCSAISSRYGAWARRSGESYVDKDLRTLLHSKVRGRFHLSYCGKGNLKACRTSLWGVARHVGEGSGRAARSRPDEVA